MAGAIHSTKHQKLAIEKNQEDQSKLFYHFLYKATIVLIFFVILPLFPSQSPEFINQSLLTGNWQLLDLLFVGAAISYALFSRRNDETEKENNSKFDTAQSLVSKFLQVSSFFEDEVETSPDETKVQIWSNQHHKNQPVVLVTPQIRHSGFDNQSCEKPLLLPVRSLKSRLCDDAGVVNVQPVVDESCTTTSFSLNKSTISKTSSKRFSSNSNRVTRNAELEEKDKKKENVVLPSPIPWRSRSGRILEPKQEEVDTLTQQSSKPSMEEFEFNKVEPRVFKSQTLRSSQTSSLSPSPKFAPSSESLVKNAEDSLNKAFNKSCTPPPSPPPPVMFQKSISMKPRYGSFNERASFDKELKRSFTSAQNCTKSGIEVKKKSEEKEHSMQEPTREYVASVGSMEFGDEEKERFIDNVLVESDDDDEEEEDTEEAEEEDVGGGRISQNMSEESSHVGGESSKIEGPSFGSDEGPDVDKKADEFIAKFREQIRLQRIESIKRTTRTARNSSR